MRHSAVQGPNARRLWCVRELRPWLSGGGIESAAVFGSGSAARLVSCDKPIEPRAGSVTHAGVPVWFQDPSRGTPAADSGCTRGAVSPVLTHPKNWRCCIHRCQRVRALCGSTSYDHLGVIV